MMLLTEQNGAKQTLEAQHLSWLETYNQVEGKAVALKHLPLLKTYKQMESKCLPLLQTYKQVEAKATALVGNIHTGVSKSICLCWKYIFAGNIH